jgi:GntR family transcriptional regulator/MocR family aminotransferase
VSLTDGMGNTLTEDAAAELIVEGELRRHVRRVTQIYGVRRRAFDDQLKAIFGSNVDYRVPDGGLAFWLRFPDQTLLDRIEAGASAQGLRFAASASFMTTPAAPRGLRLGFGSLSEGEAERALTGLAVAGGLAAASQGGRRECH